MYIKDWWLDLCYKDGVNIHYKEVNQIITDITQIIEQNKL